MKPRPPQQSTIASLAILKVNSDAGADYIDNFVPFVAEAMRRSSTDLISLTELHASLLADFGIDVPVGPLRTVLDRAVSEGYATRRDRVYVRDTSKLAGLGFSDVRDRVLRDVAALVRRLENHTRKLLPTPWEADEAEAALLLYLASRGTSLLAASAADIPIALPADSVPDSEYVLASFISELHREDHPGFEFLTTAVQGSVLSSVLYFDDFGSINRRFNKLDVYLDTGVLLQGLGWLGPDIAGAATGMFDLARELGCRLLCFEETKKELVGILDFTARHIRSGRAMREPVWGASEYLVNSGKTSSDIDLMSLHIVDDLLNIGVAVRRRPPPIVNLTVDEEEFEKVLRDRVTYRSDEPVKHDLDALTAIHRLRDGEVIPRLEDAISMFVTGNQAVARATTHFFREAYQSTSFAPLCMPAHQFGTLLWLKKPLNAPDLPRRLVIADALAALNPPASVWRQYMAEVDRLQTRGEINRDDYYLLRFTPAAKEALMGITVGGSREFLEGSVPEILNRVRASERREAEEEAARQRTMREEAEAVAALELERVGADAAASLAKVTSAKEAIELREARRRRHREQSYHRVASRLAAVPRYLATVLVIGLALVNLYSAAPTQPLGPILAGLPTHPIVGAVLLIIGGVSVVSSFVDTGFSRRTRKAEERLALRIAERLRHMFGDGEEEGLA